MDCPWNRRELQYLVKELGLGRANLKSDVLLERLQAHMSEMDERGLNGRQYCADLIEFMPEEMRTTGKTPRKTPSKGPVSTPGGSRVTRSARKTDVEKSEPLFGFGTSVSTIKEVEESPSKSRQLNFEMTEEEEEPTGMFQKLLRNMGFSSGSTSATKKKQCCTSLTTDVSTVITEKAEGEERPLPSSTLVNPENIDNIDVVVEQGEEEGEVIVKDSIPVTHTPEDPNGMATAVIIEEEQESVSTGVVIEEELIEEEQESESTGVVIEEEKESVSTGVIIEEEQESESTGVDMEEEDSASTGVVIEKELIEEEQESVSTGVVIEEELNAEEQESASTGVVIEEELIEEEQESASTGVVIEEELNAEEQESASTAMAIEEELNAEEQESESTGVDMEAEELESTVVDLKEPESTVGVVEKIQAREQTETLDEEMTAGESKILPEEVLEQHIDEMDESRPDTGRTNEPEPETKILSPKTSLVQDRVSDDQELSEIQTLVESLDDLSFNERGRVHCAMTGHDMVLRKPVILAHLQGKKYQQAKKKHSPDSDASAHGHYFVPYPDAPQDYLVCTLTDKVIVNSAQAQARHTQGALYQSQLQTKLKGLPAPQGTKVYFE